MFRLTHGYCLIGLVAWLACSHIERGRESIQHGDAGSIIDASAPDDLSVEASSGDSHESPHGEPDERLTKCGPSRTLMFAYKHQIPEGDVSFISPYIAVNSRDLFCLLSWEYPVEAGIARRGALVRIPLTGGSFEMLASLPDGAGQSTHTLLATETHVVYTRAGQSLEDPELIVSHHLDDGESMILAQGSGRIYALTGDAEQVYFIDGDAVNSVSLNGSEVQNLRSPRVNSIRLADQTLYLADDGTVSALSIETREIREVARDQAWPMYPLRCGNDVCWTNVGGLFASTIVRAAPGQMPRVLASGFSEPHDLVFDGQQFFLSSGAGGLRLDRIPAEGGEPSTVAGGIGMASLALDDDCLYWADFEGVWSILRINPE